MPTSNNKDYTQLANCGSVVRSDGVFIPNDPRNADWQEYMRWQAHGNKPKSPPGQDKKA